MLELSTFAFVISILTEFMAFCMEDIFLLHEQTVNDAIIFMLSWLVSLSPSTKLEASLINFCFNASQKMN